MNRMPRSTSTAGSVPAYTVVWRSGARGTEFADPDLAAQAFSRADASHRPFVLRHQGNSSVVIASTNKGRKAIRPMGVTSDRFVFALRSLLGAEEEGEEVALR